MTIAEALELVHRDLRVTVVFVREPWWYEPGPGYLGGGGSTLCSPGLVDASFLRKLRGVRAWKPEDAK